MRADQERVRKLLTEAVTLLCRNSLQYEEEVTVEGLLGITLDKKDIFLVSINEVIETGLKVAKRSHEDVENSRPNSPSSSKKLKRRHSQDNVPTQSQNQLVQPKLEPCDSSYDDHRLDESAVEIKIERTEHNDNHNKFSTPNPPNDCISNSKPPGQGHDRIHNPNSNNNSQLNTSAIDGDQSSFLSSSDMKIKEENKDEDFACFVIDSDEEENYMDDLSDNSRSNPLPPNASFSEVTNWSSDAGLRAFANNDPNVMDQFEQFQGDPSKWENYDMSQMPGGSNMSGDGSSPFNSQDPNQRVNVFCPICSKSMTKSWLKNHIKEVHLKDQVYNCVFCGIQFRQNRNLMRHMRKNHPDSLTQIESKTTFIINNQI